jgi:hypothetical protein
MASPAHSYFVTIDGQKHGPYRAQQVRSKLAQGKLSEADFIWRDGFPEWVPIASIISKFPGAIPPPVPDEAITRVNELRITHPNAFPTTVLQMPAKGIFEPLATLKQKNLLMKMGGKNPDLLRILGREQASFMIDAFIRDKDNAVRFELEKRAQERHQHSMETLEKNVPILLIIAGGIAIGALVYYLLR